MGVQTTCEDFQKKSFCFTCVEKSAKVLYLNLFFGQRCKINNIYILYCY